MIDLELWKTKRKELKMSLNDLSAITQVSISTLKDIFRGATTDPRIETVQRIEKALGIEKEKAPTDLTDGELKLILSLRVMSQEKREMVMSMFNAVLNAQTND